MGEEARVLIAAADLKKHFIIKNSIVPEKRLVLKAVDGIDLAIAEDETVGLVGESGCGKSTFGRALIRLSNVTAGSVHFQGTDITHLGAAQLRPYRQKMQIVFQDPYASLNPRMQVLDAVKAPLDVTKTLSDAERKEKVLDILDTVGLGRQHMDKFPHELSGGQRQRVVIARALISDPAFVVCDEAVSALDVSVRSQILNLIKRIQRERRLSYLFISHDLSVVRYLCDRVAVMYLGKILELGSKADIFGNPLHPYTKALLAAVPIPDINKKRPRILLSGEVPSPLNPPQGCRFHMRCPHCMARCTEEMPALRGSGHKVACHLNG